MAYRRGSTKPRSGGSRWMDLIRPGTCHVCGAGLAAGTRAFWHAGTRTTTCTNIECAEKAGLTEDQWHGSPTSGRYVTVLAAQALGFTVGEHADPFAKTRSRGYYGRDAGRCEDAPCCGCC